MEDHQRTDPREQLRQAEETLQWSQSLVKSPEWVHLVKIIEENARDFATKANRPAGIMVEYVNIGDQTVPVSVDGVTQAAIREYNRGLRDGLLMLRDAIPKIAEQAEELVKENRYKVKRLEEEEDFERQKAFKAKEVN